jgi:HEAT repeat protein
MRDKKRLYLVALALAVANLSASLGFAETADEVRAKALAVLKSDASFEQKAAACEDLRRFGDRDCVPILAGMLGDEQLAHRARYALESIPDRSVEEALRAALDRLNGKSLCGVISSIGVRRDSAAVEMLGKRLGSDDGEVVRTTAIALGRIGTPAAGKAMLDALKDAKGDNTNRICDGLLSCGANLAAQGQQDKAKEIYDALLAQNLPARFRVAALRGAVLCDSVDGMKRLSGMLHDNDYGVFAMALRVAAEMKDKKVADVLVAEIGKLPADRVLAVVKVLAQRRDKAAVPLLLDMAAKGEKDARLEAIQSLAEIGDPSAMPAFVELMKDKDGPIATSAAVALTALPGAEVDATIVKMLDQFDSPLRIKMIEIAGQRRAAGAMPAILKAMSDAEILVRMAAVRSYGELAGPSGIPVLIDTLTKSADAREIALGERTLASVMPMASEKDACAGRLAAALSKAGTPVKPALLRVLRVAGGPEALQAVRGAVEDADKDVRATAFRVLGEWMSVDAAPLLLDLAKNSREPADKLLALRGYLGIALQNSVAATDRLAICRQAAPLIQRPEEKRMLLGALGSVAGGESLDLIVSYLDDPAVRREAVATVMAIAEKRKPKQHTGVAQEALEKVLKVAADDAAVVKRAEELLKQIANEKK